MNIVTDTRKEIPLLSCFSFSMLGKHYQAFTNIKSHGTSDLADAFRGNMGMYKVEYIFF